MKRTFWAETRAPPRTNDNIMAERKNVIFLRLKVKSDGQRYWCGQLSVVPTAFICRSTKMATRAIVVVDEPERPVFVVPPPNKKRESEWVPLNVPSLPVPALELSVSSVTVQAKLLHGPDLDILSGRMYPDYRTWFEPSKRKQQFVTMKFPSVLDCSARVHESGAIEVTGALLRLDTLSVPRMVIEAVADCVRRSGQPSTLVDAPALSAVTCRADFRRAVDLNALAATPGAKVVGGG